MSINKITGGLDPTQIGKTSTKSGLNKTAEAKSGEITAQESAVSALSGQSNELNSAPFDAAKVEKIRQAIREGKFEVNPDAVASGIIASAKELIGQR